jgi:hypothetical protein
MAPFTFRYDNAICILPLKLGVILVRGIPNACSWDARGHLTLNSLAQIQTSVTLLTSRDLAWSSGRLTCQHASQISAVAHIS